MKILIPLKKLGINILLFIVANLLLFTIGTFGLIYGILYKIIKVKISLYDFIEYLSKILYAINVGIDQIGNVLLSVFLNNSTTINKTYYTYGRIDQTISHVLAVNYFNNNLTKFGHFIVNILEFLDPGHMEKSL